MSPPNAGCLGGVVCEPLVLLCLALAAGQQSVTGHFLKRSVRGSVQARTVGSALVGAARPMKTKAYASAETSAPSAELSMLTLPT